MSNDTSNDTTAKLKAVIFDFGGVFTDSPFHAFTAYAEKIGASDKQVTDIAFGGYGHDGSHPWHQVERGEISLESARDSILALGQAQGLNVDIWEVFMAMAENGGGLRTELVEYVAKIRASGLGTGIITNNVLELKEHWRGMLPVDDLFDFVIDSSEVGMRKPNPAIFVKALEIGGLAAEEVIFLDDFEGNVIAARELNIRSILVDGDGAKTVADLDAALGLN
ncbi:HAD family hydrolase [Candidatus Marimicrobium litorale]|uniref:HAD family phosphatase n=1 Tax=Candidatus Marimicrobium litorale TaxID=2518991 RepID=A0ABT3T994_9GAMM|nr:HAD family phosphatase [Candidatus Marimicrobium litorale]MCX2978868.1 HAD family phosphatase [Candidatus Marimicrobium litorale]